jgi:HTH-type transcriptional regulator / antitoxin HigA
MSEKNQFNPDWVSRPGDTIADVLDERSYSQIEFAQRMGYTAKEANDLLRSRAPLSPEAAQKLELVLGATAEFWLERDIQYRGTGRPSLGVSKPRTDEAWLKELPVKSMYEYGWLRPDLFARSPAEACLRFFAVADVEAWRATYNSILDMVSFRTSIAFRSRPGALAAWLRQGEIQAASIECEPWDAQAFRKALFEMRRLTRKRDPRLFLPELVKRSADCGVAVAVVRSPDGCRASGATRFLSSRKALLLLSFRYLSDDHFWFTFFHEAGHLLLHSKRAVFLEGATTSSAEEVEANQFSASILIPSQFQGDLQALNVERHQIRNFAKAIGISPGIVIGQLQHSGKARRNQLNTLKARFTWANPKD